MKTTKDILELQMYEKSEERREEEAKASTYHWTYGSYKENHNPYASDHKEILTWKRLYNKSTSYAFMVWSAPAAGAIIAFLINDNLPVFDVTTVALVPLCTLFGQFFFIPQFVSMKLAKKYREKQLFQAPPWWIPFKRKLVWFQRYYEVYDRLVQDEKSILNISKISPNDASRTAEAMLVARQTENLIDDINHRLNKLLNIQAALDKANIASVPLREKLNQQLQTLRTAKKTLETQLAQYRENLDGLLGEIVDIAQTRTLVNALAEIKDTDSFITELETKMSDVRDRMKTLETRHSSEVKELLSKEQETKELLEVYGV